ncbi:hypothetical protein ACFOKF_19215 [Sphingobium rhizovicinum]|uniref:Peptidoglycan polymerase n=1 Tax=Sphingobium rhizovicinum TaxID=432308 RepID=A0ABV7NJF2_9SPHN
MSAGLRRRLIDLACHALQATLPEALQSWGWAVRCEADAIPDDTKALLFTLDSLCGLMPRAIASHLFQPFSALVGNNSPLSQGSTIMKILDAATARPRTLGLICAICSVALGLAYMAVAGAPMRYLGVNMGALAIGLTMLALLGRIGATARQWADGANIAMAGALLATALFGSQVDGAARWVSLGGLAIQPSLILLPMMLVAFSKIRSVPMTASIVAAALAMALQPDRAMAGMLISCLSALALIRPDRHVGVALAAGFASFAATLLRADHLPAVPYVDQILYSSFAIHAVAGLMVLAGVGLLLVPAIAGWSRDADNRAPYAAFGAVWFAAIMAAALGNYPTPIVGYGGSAIIGYALSLLMLPKLSGAHAEADRNMRRLTNGSPSNRHLFVALT